LEHKAPTVVEGRAGSKRQRVREKDLQVEQQAAVQRGDRKPAIRVKKKGRRPAVRTGLHSENRSPK
jgi:hypothetical protein